MRRTMLLFFAVAASPLAAQSPSPAVQCKSVGVPAATRIAACSQLIDDPSSSPENKAAGLYFRSTVKAKEKNYSAAIADLDAALALPTAEGVKEDVLIRKALVLRIAKREAEASRVLDAAVKLRGSANALNERGDFRSEKKDYRGALADYDLANAKGSTDWSSWNSACYTRAAYLNIQIARARSDCAKANALKPDDHLILDSMGMVELRARNYDKADEYYSRAIALRGRFASARYGRAVAAVAKKRAAGLSYGPYDIEDVQSAKLEDPKIGEFYASIGFPDPTK